MIMLLLFHILIALGSLGFTTYLYISPSKSKFRLAYGLVGGTLASGTALVISTRSHLLSSCLTGLAYLGAASFGLAMAHNKLAAQKNKVNKTD